MVYNGPMASRKTTAELKRAEMRLIRACEIANQDPELRQIEKEFDAITDEIPEPWEDAI
jgi:hypothetical protein